MIQYRTKKNKNRIDLEDHYTLRRVFEKCHFNVYKIGAGKRRTVYKWLHMGFDIETTTLYERDKKEKPVDYASLMWIWQYSINDFVFFGRTWKEFIFFINELADFFGLNSILKIRSVCFIHNASFEFQHMRKYLDDAGLIENVFARNERQPLKIDLTNGITFLDSAKITNTSLEYLAKQYTETQKLVGDLDYSKLRSPLTTSITEEEYDYCANDVIILSEYSDYFEKTFIKDGYAPLTSTSMVRFAMRQEFKKLSKKEREDYHSFIWSCFPWETDYKHMMAYLFQGGYVHANIMNVGKLIEKDLEADKKSAYPTAMFCYDGFPMTPFRRVKPDLADTDKLRKEMCCWMIVEFTDLRAKTPVTVISQSKCLSILSPTIDNGRVYKAKKICVAVTELDLEIIEKYYNFKKEKILHMKVAKRGYLPGFLRKLVIDFFLSKESTPKSDTKLYNLRKALLNSIYGCFVTRLVFDESIYKEGNWQTVAKNKEETAKVFIDAKRRGLLLPQWGVWVTSYCRHDILSVVWDLMQLVKTGVKDYLYTDTDSIKNKYRPEYLAYYEAYNKKRIEENVKLMSDFGLTPEQIEKAKILGIYDIEGSGRFKTLGAKRYLSTAKGKLTCTIAGLPKHVLPTVCKEKGKDPFEFFRNNMRFKYTDTDKLTSYYVDNPRHVHFIDIDGNEIDEDVPSCLPLIPTTFRLGLTSDFLRLINIIQHDAIFENILEE